MKRSVNDPPSDKEEVYFVIIWRKWEVRIQNLARSGEPKTGIASGIRLGCLLHWLPVSGDFLPAQCHLFAPERDQ